ncbi:MAG: carboxypeptidase regulatory-like domain-containing protein [Dehalococcoidia bacterium]
MAGDRLPAGQQRHFHLSYAGSLYSSIGNYYAASILVESAAPTIGNSIIDHSNCNDVEVISGGLPVIHTSSFGSEPGVAYGVTNDGWVAGQPLVDATNDWWGAADGPSGDQGVASGHGVKVSAGVNFAPFLSTAPGGGPTPSPTATIRGTVRRDSPSGSLVGGASVQICSTGGGNNCHVTSTDAASGQYSVAGLAVGQYSITVNPPAGSPLLPNSVTATVDTDGQTVTQDIVLTSPAAPPAGTTITGVINAGGVPVVFWAEPLTLTTHACHLGTVTYQILFYGRTIQSGAMIEGLDGTFTAIVPQLRPSHGPATVTFSVANCGALTIPPFTIYIDPSGSVQTDSGRPIAGVMVTLLHADSAAGPFSTVQDGSAIMSPANRHNPSLTDGAGRFGWDVMSGYYQVTASKQGCSATGNSTSAVLHALDQPITDLVLTLVCPAGDVNGDGSVSAVDALCVLRSVAGLPVTASCPLVPLTLPSVGDVNGDSSVNAVDALCILRSVAGLITTPACSPPPSGSAAGQTVQAERSIGRR